MQFLCLLLFTFENGKQIANLKLLEKVQIASTKLHRHHVKVNGYPAYFDIN